MGLDTVEANNSLGFNDDLRDYRVAAEMLKALNLERISLHTNNPNKSKQLIIYGINILIALFSEEKSFVSFLLKSHGVEKFDVVKLIAHGADKPVNSEASINDDIRAELGGDEATKKSNALEEYCLNLNLEVKNKRSEQSN